MNTRNGQSDDGAHTLADHSWQPVEASNGVYYRPQDTPGLFIRCIVAIVDVMVILLLVHLCELVYTYLAVTPPPDLVVLVAAILAWGYVAILKASGIGTIGYLLFRLRLVTLRGDRPTLLRVTFRMLLTLVFNPVVDVLAMGTDDRGQAIRDKLSGTYVVRKPAVPVGSGPIIYARLHWFCLTLVYREVKQDASLAQ